MSIEKSIAALGKAYAAAERALPKILGSAAKKQTASESPLAGLAEMMRLLIANKALSDELDNYFTHTLCAVDEVPDHASLPQQSYWWAGYYSGKANTDHGLAAMRKRAGLTQAQAAEKIGALQKDISRWERGEHQPSADSLSKLANAYGCQVDDLI